MPTKYNRQRMGQNDIDPSWDQKPSLSQPLLYLLEGRTIGCRNNYPPIVLLQTLKNVSNEIRFSVSISTAISKPSFSARMSTLPPPGSPTSTLAVNPALLRGPANAFFQNSRAIDSAAGFPFVIPKPLERMCDWARIPQPNPTQSEAYSSPSMSAAERIEHAFLFRQLWSLGGLKLACSNQRQYYQCTNEGPSTGKEKLHTFGIECYQ